jgi:beta-phosphoglucomutase-like phosphatase (HAD superfamily)
MKLGIPVRDIFVKLIAEAKHLKVKPDVDKVCATKKEISLVTVAEIGTPKIEVVVDIARKYHGKVPLAVASSGNREHVMASLRDNGILDLFDAVITTEDIANPKPAPDIFLLAAHRIGCDPTKCRGYEDADVGMAALRAAGMQAVDVRTWVGYPTVTPSDRSVLLDAPDAEGSETDAKPRKNAAKGKNAEKKEDGNGGAGFMVQAVVMGVLAYGAYLLLSHLLFEAVKEDAWGED